MAVTIRDVARKCGVSVATVSRVINDSELVTDETKKKVRETIEELGFIPNKNARGLSIKRTHTIGVIVPNIANPFFGELIEGVEQAASESGYDIIILNSGYSVEKTFKDVMVLRSRDVDGIIMPSAGVDERTIDHLYDNNIPFVLMGPLLYKYPLNFVTVDNLEGARMAVDHLINLGHKRIAYVSSNYDNYLNQLRYEGYRKALSAKGIPVNKEFYFQNQVGKDVNRIVNMPKEERPTALFAFNDYTALAYMEAFERSGIQVPEDMAIVGFDNIKMASYYSIELTTIDNQQVKFGRQAVEMLLDIFNGDGTKTQQIVTKPQLVVRKSCGSK